jgi:hypothetical protein
MKNERSYGSTARRAEEASAQSVRGLAVAGIAALFVAAALGTGCSPVIAAGSPERATARSTAPAAAVDAGFSRRRARPIASFGPGRSSSWTIPASRPTWSRSRRESSRREASPPQHFA